jgi:carboxymethylenebutenolidase
MRELITIGNDSIQAKAYISQPELEKAPAVLVFHAWWGLNTFIQQLANRICVEGFVVLVPDYSLGEVASSIDQAKVLKSKMDRSYTYALAKISLDHLLASDFVLPKEVAVIGFSLGCGPALELARSRPSSVRAVVLFYGTGGGKFDAATADFLGHFAEDDQWGAHTKKVGALKDRLSKSSGSVEFHTYPQTQHWFFESDRVDEYNREAAEEAWTRTIQFLKEKLS